MKPTERIVTRLLRSRLGTYMLMGAALVSVLIASATATLPAMTTGRGLLTGAMGSSVVGASSPLLVALAAIGIIMGLMTFINGAFNLLRTSSILFVGVFAFMEAASPIISTRFGSGMIVAAGVLCAMALMYTTYQQPVTGTKRTFLVFTLLSAGSMLQYAFVAYLPVFLAGCAQMRCFTFRSLLAAVAGMVVPWWILLGMGFITFDDIVFPTGLSIFSQLGSAGTAQLAAVIAVTVIAGFTLTLTNMVKIYNYNARSRSFTGLLVTVTIATLLLTMIDFANILAYLTLLNCCVAFQTALFFRINAENRGYITVAAVLATYFILFVWSIFV